MVAAGLPQHGSPASAAESTCKKPEDEGPPSVVLPAGGGTAPSQRGVGGSILEQRAATEAMKRTAGAAAQKAGRSCRLCGSTM